MLARVDFFEELYLSDGIFKVHTHSYAACMAYPTASYCVVIHNIEDLSSRVYDFSRTIESGEVDVFEVIVGAEKSCTAKLRFRFILENDELVSEQFSLAINRPTNWNYHNEYVDGAVRVRGVDDPNWGGPRDVFGRSQIEGNVPPFRTVTRARK